MFCIIIIIIIIRGQLKYACALRVFATISLRVSLLLGISNGLMI